MGHLAVSFRLLARNAFNSRCINAKEHILPVANSQMPVGGNLNYK